MKILSSLAHTHVIPNLYDFISSAKKTTQKKKTQNQDILKND